jgi:DNA-binding response OmpR family regulator
MTGNDKPVVLVVDDDGDLADTYGLWLRDEYEVRTAYDGESALDAVSPEVDVVLLDRRMPGMPGDEVLERIRERGLDCRVSMLTAVEPETDIIEMPFDEYLVKPVSAEDVRETVEELLRRGELDEELREYMSLSSTLAALEAEGDTDDEAVSELKAEVDARREEAEATLEEMDFEQAFREV